MENDDAKPDNTPNSQTDDLNAILNELRKLAQIHHQLQTWFLSVWMGSSLILTILFMISLTVKSVHFAIFFFVLSFVVLFSALLFMHFFEYGSFSKRFKELLMSVAKSRDIELIPIYVDVLGFEWAELIAEQGLINLLPQITEQHRGILDKSQQRRLWDQIFQNYGRRSRHAPLQLIILTFRAMSLIADVSYLKKLKSASRSSRYIASDAFHKAAEEGIRVMEERILDIL